MWEQIGNWLYQNAMAIFISAVASLLISKRYYDKANRESVLMTVIFPIGTLTFRKQNLNIAKTTTSYIYIIK